MQWLSGHSKDVRSVAFTPDGQIVSGGSDKTVRIWDVSTGECTTTIKAKFVVYAVAVSPDGQLLAYAGRYLNADDPTNAVFIWDLHSGKDDDGWVFSWQRFSNYGSFPRSIWALSFSSDGSVLAAAGRILGGGNIPNGGGGAWCDTETRTTRGELPENTYAVAFSPWGSTMALTRERAVEFRKSLDAVDQTTYRLQCDWANAIAFADQGNSAIVAAGSYLHFVDPRTFVKKTTKIKTGLRTVTALAVSPDGGSILAGGKPGTVELYEGESRTLRRKYDFGIGGVHALAMAPDGLTFAVAGDKGLVRCDLEEA